MQPQEVAYRVRQTAAMEIDRWQRMCDLNLEARRLLTGRYQQGTEARLLAIEIELTALDSLDGQPNH